MILDVDPQAALPVNEQIREQITRMTVSGILPVGERLPAIRQLASDLQLAKGTVAKAYALLERDGVVESRGRRGTFVTEVAPPAEVAGSLAAAAERYVTICRQLGVDEERALKEVGTEWRR